MQQFGSIPSTSTQPIPPGFKREDGRGKGEKDWMRHHQIYVTLWNLRRNYITPLNPPQGDGKKEYKYYMRWYKLWATMFLLKPSKEAPITYHPKAPAERTMVDYYMQTRAIAGPYHGGYGESASTMQLALQSIAELGLGVEDTIHIDTSMYDDPDQPSSSTRDSRRRPRTSTSNVPRIMDAPRASTSGPQRGPSASGSHRSNTEGRRHSTYAGSAEEGFPSMYAAENPWMTYGGSYPDVGQSYQWATSSQQYDPHIHGYTVSTPEGVPSPLWMSSEEAEQQHDQPTQAEEAHPDDIVLEPRARHGPNKYTPGSGAIPHRRRYY